ncbi:TetR/AcrR family transcriptional regulator [Blastococcus sp. SYSU D00669]
MTRPSSRPYHHGNLRPALLEAAVEVIDEHGPTAVSLRDLARRTGVSHAAPAHHFGDKAGLLTAVAAQGYELLAEALDTASRSGDFAEVGVAYVLFAAGHPGHFSVMFRPDLYRTDDPDVVAARTRTTALLRDGARARFGTPDRIRALTAWSLVHGLATLVRDGAVVPDPGSDLQTLARSVTRGLTGRAAAR